MFFVMHIKRHNYQNKTKCVCVELKKAPTTAVGVCAVVWEVLAYVGEHSLGVTLVPVPAIETSPLLHLSEPQFPHVGKEIIAAYLAAVWGERNEMCLKQISWHLDNHRP